MDAEAAVVTGERERRSMLRPLLSRDSMPSEPLLVIVNPRAGRGRARRRAEALFAALRRANVAFVERTTSGPGDALAFARDATSTVVVVGGDGTVNEAVNGLAEPRRGERPPTPFAVFAAGSGNDFVGNVGFSRDADEFVRRLQRPAVRTVDVGHATIACEHGTLARRFVNDVGLGFEAQVAATAARGRWLRGLPLYAVATARALWRQRVVACEVEYEDEATFVRETLPILFVSACNGRRVGGGLFFAPEARLDDRRLDVLRVTAASRRATVALFARLLRRRHLADERVRLVRCATMTAIPREPLPLVVDGEVVAHRATRIVASLAPESLVVADGS